MTFLTTQPVKESGVNTNQVRGGAEFSFPGGRDNWIEPARDEIYTVIFSQDALRSPSFLSLRAGRRLTPTEEGELTVMRSRAKADRRLVEERSGNETIIKAESGKSGPLIFDIPIKLQSRGTSN